VHDLMAGTLVWRTRERQPEGCQSSCSTGTTKQSRTSDRGMDWQPSGPGV